MHESGIGTPRDRARASTYYEMACTAGDARGCANRAGLADSTGAAVTGAAARRSADVMEKSCASNVETACAMLGTYFESGRGRPQDRRRATELYGRACRADVMEACVSLGALLSNGGAGVTRDRARAVRLFVQGCDAKVAMGCTNLGVAYRRGIGVPVDTSRARDFFAKGCQLGDDEGCRRNKAR